MLLYASSELLMPRSAAGRYQHWDIVMCIVVKVWHLECRPWELKLAEFHRHQGGVESGARSVNATLLDEARLRR